MSRSKPAPHAAPELERAVLGALLLDPARIADLIETVPGRLLHEALETFESGKRTMPGLMIEMRNELILGALMSMTEAGLAVDLQGLGQHLLDAGRLDAVGGAEYLATLEDDVMVTSLVGQHLRTLLDKYAARTAAQAARKLETDLGAGVAPREAVAAHREALTVIEGMVLDSETKNRAATLEDFLTVEREALTYHIAGVLPERGKLTISARAKGFKTTFLIHLGLCAAAGNVEYLNFRFMAGVPVLFVQPELSDGLLVERMNWIMRTAPAWLDRDAARGNFHILETTHGRPSLWHDHPRAELSRRELTKAIEQTGAKIVLVDSLYMSFAGMDENAADQMTLALDYLGSLTVSHGVSVILVHHFNKSGTAARGSSVYQGWGETDLTISNVDNDDEVVQVDALMRCAFPKGFPAYWQRPGEHGAWFELMPVGFRPEKSTKGRPAGPGPQLVGLVLGSSQARAMSFTELRTAILDTGMCKKRKAESLISEAVKLGIIIKGADRYVLPQK